MIQVQIFLFTGDLLRGEAKGKFEGWGENTETNSYWKIIQEY